MVALLKEKMEEEEAPIREVDEILGDLEYAQPRVPASELGAAAEAVRSSLQLGAVLPEGRSYTSRLLRGASALSGSCDEGAELHLLLSLAFPAALLDDPESPDSRAALESWSKGMGDAHGGLCAGVSPAVALVARHLATSDLAPMATLPHDAWYRCEGDHRVIQAFRAVVMADADEEAQP